MRQKLFNMVAVNTMLYSIFFAASFLYRPAIAMLWSTKTFLFVVQSIFFTLSTGTGAHIFTLTFILFGANSALSAWNDVYYNGKTVKEAVEDSVKRTLTLRVKIAKIKQAQISKAQILKEIDDVKYDITDVKIVSHSPSILTRNIAFRMMQAFTASFIVMSMFTIFAVFAPYTLCIGISGAAFGLSLACKTLSTAITTISAVTMGMSTLRVCYLAIAKEKNVMEIITAMAGDVTAITTLAWMPLAFFKDHWPQSQPERMDDKLGNKVGDKVESKIEDKTDWKSKDTTSSDKNGSEHKNKKTFVQRISETWNNVLHK